MGHESLSLVLTPCHQPIPGDRSITHTLFWFFFLYLAHGFSFHCNAF